jgi:hypothetical protein
MKRWRRKKPRPLSLFLLALMVALLFILFAIPRSVAIVQTLATAVTGLAVVVEMLRRRSA